MSIIPTPPQLIAALEVLNLASRLVNWALTPAQEADCWDKINKIAAEHAASPAIQGFADHA
jgi:hypothetical protein